MLLMCNFYLPKLAHGEFYIYLSCIDASTEKLVIGAYIQPIKV